MKPRRDRAVSFFGTGYLDKHFRGYAGAYPRYAAKSLFVYNIYRAAVQERLQIVHSDIHKAYA
jgi:hypothetical protein